MSMYTQLLDAALEQRPLHGGESSPHHAVEEVRRRRDELDVGVPDGADLDTVPAVLALQIGYDVALLELAAVMGIESGPSCFEQPELERDRLRRALRARGISFDTATDRRRSPSTPRPRAPDGRAGQVPLASDRASWFERSLRRAANVAACVRRSMPSLASRLDT